MGQGAYFQRIGRQLSCQRFFLRQTGERAIKPIFLGELAKQSLIRFSQESWRTCHRAYIHRRVGGRVRQPLFFPGWWVSVHIFMDKPADGLGRREESWRTDQRAYLHREDSRRVGKPIFIRQIARWWVKEVFFFKQTCERAIEPVFLGELAKESFISDFHRRAGGQIRKPIIIGELVNVSGNLFSFLAGKSGFHFL